MHRAGLVPGANRPSASRSPLAPPPRARADSAHSAPATLQVHPGDTPEPALRLRAVDRRYFDQLCARVFGRSLRPDTASTRRNYRGADLGVDLRATNIIFTFGRDDPWRSAWPMSQPFATSPAGAAAVAPSGDAAERLRHFSVDCDDCAHCVDLGQTTPSSPEALRIVREVIGSTIEQWLAEA